MPFKYFACASLLALCGCMTQAESNPPRTATEQLLVSAAAERAAAVMDLNLPLDTKIFIDSGNFEGTDSKYAIGAIRAAFLRQGVHVVDDRKNATLVVELRSGALSTDRKSFLIGIPQFSFPVPLASGPLTIPEIALYASDDQEGIAKFAATVYDVEKGSLIENIDPRFGYSHNKKKTVLFFYSWNQMDAAPKDDEQLIKPASQPGLKAP